MSFGARLRISGRNESRRGGEQWPVRRATASSARPSSERAEDGDGREGRDEAGSFEVVREVKSGARRRPQSPVWRRGVTVTSTGVRLFTRLNDFCPSLTR